MPFDENRRRREQDRRAFLDTVNSAAEAAITGLRPIGDALGRRDLEALRRARGDYDGVDHGAVDDYAALPAPSWPSYAAHGAVTRYVRALTAFEAAADGIILKPQDEAVWARADASHQDLQDRLTELDTILDGLRPKP